MRTDNPLSARLVLVMLLLVSGFIVACGNSDAGAADQSSLVVGELPCDVSALLVESCQGCHSSPPKFGAPMPLVTYADVMRAGANGRVVDHMRKRLADRSMPPASSSPVSQPKIDLFDRWVSEGAKPRAASEQCAVAPAAPSTVVPKGLACTPDTHVGPARPYAIKADVPDEYVCYGFDIARQNKRHVIGLGPRVDNPNVVHHILLFRSPTAVAGEPAPCPSNPPLDWQLHAAWAPGGDAIMLPEEAGFPEEGVSHWAAQIHYSNLQRLSGQVDASGYDLCTTEQLRRHDAGILATGTMNLTIPPRSESSTTCHYNWGAGATGDFRTKHPDVKVFSVMPHMHKLGSAMAVHRLAPGLPRVTLVDSKFDFGAQSTYAVNVPVGGLDQITTRCTFKNSTDKTVQWGEDTSSEMCFAFLSYYPAVAADPLWNWSVPSVSLGTTCYQEDASSKASPGP